MAKQNILIVDSDPESVKVLEVSLKKAGYSVTTAEDGDAALELLEFSSPDLVISDTKMSGLSGFEFCTRLKQNDEWAKIPFIFLTADKSIENKIRGLELGVDDYLNKPIFIREILVRVNLAIQRRQKERLERRGNKSKFSGNLQDMGLVDLLQTIDLGNKTGVLHIIRMSDEGTIYFRDGRIIDAATRTRTGADAVYRMLVWSDGTFEIEFTNVDREDRVRLPTQGLLMEGMRRLDEWGRLQEQLPPLTAVFDVDEAVLAERLGEIPDEVNMVLKHFDSRATLMEVVDNGDLGDLEALTLISKLYFEGLIQEVSATPSSVDGTMDPNALLPEPSGAWIQSRPPRHLPSRVVDDAVGPHMSTAADFAGMPPETPTDNPVAPVMPPTTGGRTVVGMPVPSDLRSDASSAESTVTDEPDEPARFSQESVPDEEADGRGDANAQSGKDSEAASPNQETGTRTSVEKTDSEKIAAAIDAELPPPNFGDVGESQEDDSAYFDGSTYSASLGPRPSYDPGPYVPSRSPRSDSEQSSDEDEKDVSKLVVSGDPFSGPLEEWPEDPPEVPRGRATAIVIAAIVLAGVGVGLFFLLQDNSSEPPKAAAAEKEDVGKDEPFAVKPLIDQNGQSASEKTTDAQAVAKPDTETTAAAAPASTETTVTQAPDAPSSSPALSSEAAPVAGPAATPGDATSVASDAPASTPATAVSEKPKPADLTPEQQKAVDALLDRVDNVGRRKKIAIYREVLAINPADDRALAGLSIQLLEAKQTRPEALELAQQAIVINSDNAVAWMAKGYVLQLEDQMDAAKEAYRRCAECSGPTEYTRECGRLAR